MAKNNLPNQNTNDDKKVLELPTTMSNTLGKQEAFDIDDLSAEEQIIALKKEIESLKKKKNKAQKRYQRELALKPYQAELISLQNYLEDTHKRMIIVFEGRDASGKGGTIRRVARYMNEKRYRTVALGKPTSEQRSQWYFQRYITQFPHGGETVLFDRSWYNRAMVEPVLGFCTAEEHKNFMKGVVGFEKDLVRQGTILIKFYFSVTKGEQAARFERRKTDPLRQWKLSDSAAPWTIIRSNDKHAARMNVLRVILNSVPYKNKNPDLDYVPNPDIVVSGAREIETMEVDRLNKGKFKA